MVLKAQKKKEAFLSQAAQYVRALEPMYVMPFAGEYLLTGQLARLNPYRGVPTLDEAFQEIEVVCKIYGGRCILLNQWACFDLETGNESQDYAPTDLNDMQDYIDTVLSKKFFTYEYDDEPMQEGLIEGCFEAFRRVEKKRRAIGTYSETTIFVSIRDEVYFAIPMNGSPPYLREYVPSQSCEPYVIYRSAPKLLSRLLRGPRFAHWNNAEIGSHIEFYRSPDVFERDIHFCMSFFHA